MKRLATIILGLLLISACSRGDEAHTTETRHISPPPHQKLIVVQKPTIPRDDGVPADPAADKTKPLLIFHLENGKKFRVGEEVPIEFSVMNAKLKGDGGDFRVRYIVDDEDMKWIDTTGQTLWLSGWTPGNHTIRVELIGADLWPYKNGNANIVTREIVIGN
jgi:hypothetical protein